MNRDDFGYACPFAFEFEKHLDEHYPHWHYVDGKVFRDTYIIYFSQINSDTGQKLHYSVSARIIDGQPRYSSAMDVLS